MIQSMTGYGAVEKAGFRIEVKSVNHRFLDMSFRMPPFLQPYEMEMRSIVKSLVSRGKVDVRISLTGEAGLRLDINRSFIKELFAVLKDIKGELSLEGGPSLDHLFWYKDLIFEEEPDYDSEELLNVLKDAVQRMVKMRETEGEHLKKALLESLDILESHLSEVIKLSSNTLEQSYQKIRERLTELLGEGVDETRLIQEAAFLAERADIEEEIERIKSHIDQFRKIISQGGTIGRKMDFILQELLRETNTIGSKASEYAISERVVHMKAEIERMKEQVQNIQ
ncbi:MAG: YicC family protein [Nitrospirae bacterium]|nr:MAG: YicC family protein [Nitrospirota bacterium]